MIYYKIREKAGARFVKGTPSYHSYNTRGRVFQTIGALRAFLNAVMDKSYLRKNIADWEIVEFELQEHAVKGVHEIIKPEKLVELLTE